MINLLYEDQFLVITIGPHQGFLATFGHCMYFQISDSTKDFSRTLVSLILHQFNDDSFLPVLLFIEMQLEEPTKKTREKRAN